jgi:Ca-activated chloride channel family protein
LGAASQFTSSVNVVEVYASVTDARGEPVTGLTREDFDVLEDGATQSISTFAAGEVPLAVALAIDRSFSMKPRNTRMNAEGPRNTQMNAEEPRKTRMDAQTAPLEMAKAAARVFLGELRPADRALVLAIGSQVEEVAPLSTDRATQAAAVDRLDAWGTTPLHDAIAAAVERIQPAGGRRALVLLSDGDDRYSKYRAVDVLALARQSDVMIYPIAVGPRRPPLFAELAALSGGRSMHLRDPRALADALRGIARELRSQYLLGYTPVRPLTEDEGEWRSITVRVKRPGLRVRARDGYLVR